MGFLDALSGIFSSGSSAGGYAGPNPFLMALGGLASRFRATPNPGASRGDIERANRINLLSGLLGAGVNAYGAYSDNQGKQQALQGLFDIYKQGGTQPQGPMPDGSAMPKLGLAESIFAWGAQNPGLSDQAMQLGLQAQGRDFEREKWKEDLEYKKAEQQADAEYRKAMLENQQAEARASAAYRNQSLGLQQQELQLRREESEAMRPLKEAQFVRGIYGDDAANEFYARRGAPSLGITPQARPQQQNQYMTPIDGGGQQASDGNMLQDILGRQRDAKINEASIKRLDALNADPQFREVIDQANGAQQSMEQFAGVLKSIGSSKNGDYLPQHRAILAKLVQQNVEKGLAVSPTEIDQAISPSGNFTNSRVGRILRDFFGTDGLDDVNVGAALETMAGLTAPKLQAANAAIAEKRKYGLITGLAPRHESLIGSAYNQRMDDPYKYAQDALAGFQDLRRGSEMRRSGAALGGSNMALGYAPDGSGRPVLRRIEQ